MERFVFYIFFVELSREVRWGRVCWVVGFFFISLFLYVLGRVWVLGLGGFG